MPEKTWDFEGWAEHYDQGHPANTEPTDRRWIASWGYTPGDPGRVLEPSGTIAEMADRTHGNNWSPDLPAALYPLQSSP